MAKSEWVEINTPDATVRVKLTDKLKKTVEEAYNAGFDPTKTKEEPKEKLLLPQSCMPVIEDVVSIDDNDRSDYEIADSIRKIIVEAGKYDKIAFDYTDERLICILERVLTDCMDLMKQKGVTFVLSERCKSAVENLQLKRWKARGQL
jgi:hypothetical protein